MKRERRHQAFRTKATADGVAALFDKRVGE